MAKPFVGSEAIAAWRRHQKSTQTRYTRLFRDVYIDRDAEVTAAVRARAAWLWAGPRGVVAGFSASAIHGSRWVDGRRAVELIHHNRHRVSGIVSAQRRAVEDEIDDHRGTFDNNTYEDGARSRLLVSNHDCGGGHRRVGRETEMKAADIELLARADIVGRRGITRARGVAHLSTRVAVAERVVAAHGSDRGRPAETADADTSISTNSAIRSRISTWDGKTSKSRSSTTATSIAPIDGSTAGTSADWRWSSVLAGLSSGSSPVTGPQK